MHASPLRHAFFVTGTDTDAGKTHVACALLRAAATAGYSTLGMKPVAAGASGEAGALRNDDALRLQAASSIPLPYEQINPVCLAAPASPHIAAQLAGRRVSAERLTGLCRGVLGQRADLTLIEGAGGWRVPLNEREYLSDLAKALQLPVLLVVRMRLGCLNHALLTVEAIVRDGLRVAGWIANCSDTDLHHYDANRDTLSAAFGMAPLAEFPCDDSVEAATRAAAIALDQLLAPAA